MMASLHCLRELAFLARKWTWLGRLFDADPLVDRMPACVRRRLPLHAGHAVVYPTGWLSYFLTVGALGPLRRI